MRAKTFPFSLNEMIEEFKAQDSLNHIPDDIMDMLDGEGAQNNSNVFDDSFEEIQPPEVDCSKWHDDKGNNETIITRMETVRNIYDSRV